MISLLTFWHYFHTKRLHFTNRPVLLAIGSVVMGGLAEGCSWAVPSWPAITCAMQPLCLVKLY